MAFSVKSAKSAKKKVAKAPRRRLSAEDAREAILAATEKRLREAGPDALRLQEIAHDVGLSHPTVLHHVGNREALVAAVVQRSMRTLENDLITFITPSAGPSALAETLHQVDEVMRLRGQARLVAWLALTRPDENPQDSRLGDVATAIHAARRALGKDASLEDTSFGIVLATSALFGVALIGPRLFAMLGLPDDEPTQRRFREWFAALLMEHGGIPSGGA